MAKSELFAINGRFLTQPMTGVQRYAFNVTQAISSELVSRDETAPLLSSANATDPKFAGTPLQPIGGTSGHIWEQIALPRAWPEQLLNFCNTAPVSKANQIVCIHDANTFIAPESYSASFRLFYKSMQPLIARRSAQITTVSQYSASQIALYLSLKISDIVVLPNGHEHIYAWDPQQVSQSTLDIIKKSGYENRPFILIIGSRARHKNIALALGIADELSSMGIGLVVAGGSAGIYTSDVAQRSDNIQYLGFVTDHDLAYLYKKALCLVFPSLTEGFGLPVLEAMACGCPVISTNRASLPEICGNAALLAAPDMPSQWINHVRMILESSDLREELVDKGYNQAKLFSWSKTAEGYLELTNSPKQQKKNLEITESDLPLIAVVIATLGRPDVLVQTLRRILLWQSLKPTCVIISCSKMEDAGEAATWPSVTVITGPAGLAAQRNTALAVVPDGIDVVAFFDDDFVPEAGWLQAAACLFKQKVDVIGFTGEVIVDGIKGPGLSFDDVDKILSKETVVADASLIERFSPYGCNMAFRLSSIAGFRFDERLILYGWLEDRDFGASLSNKGYRLVKCTKARGVHMGVKSGRIAGERLGYSQVVNPIYLLRKGTMTYTQVADHVLRNLLSNLVKSISPEPFIDRRGRLRGNLRGLMDAILGRVDPERAANINRNVTK